MRKNSTYERVMGTIVGLMILVLVGLVVRTFVSPSVSIQSSVEIHASPKVLWSHLIDEHKRTRWQTGVRTVVSLMGGELLMGSRSVVVKKLEAEQWEVEEEIVDFLEGHTLVFVHSAEKYVENISIELEENGDVIEVSYSSQKVHSDFWGRFFAPWAAIQEQKSLSMSLQILKRHAEAEEL